MHLVLYEEVNQRDQSSEEGACKYLAVLDCLWVWRAEHEAAGSPGDGRDQIRYHEDVMPVVVISRGDVSPPSASERSKDAHPSNEFGKRGVGSIGEEVPEAY